MTYIMGFLASALFPSLLAAYGVYLAIKTFPVNERNRPLWIVAVLTVLCLIVGGLQQYAASGTDTKNDAKNEHTDSVLAGISKGVGELVLRARTPYEMAAALSIQAEVEGLRNSIQAPALPTAKTTPADAEQSLLATTKKLKNALITYLATSGYASLISPDPVKNVSLMQQRGYFTPYVSDSCIAFFVLSDRLIQTTSTREPEFAIANQKGLDTLEVLNSVPLEKIVVVNPSVPLFLDFAGTQKVSEAVGIIVKYSGTIHEGPKVQVYPTTKSTYYRTGMGISFEWDQSRIWRENMWYRDPKTKTMTLATSGSENFVGRDLKELWVK